jgi:hypothetical protein
MKKPIASGLAGAFLAFGMMAGSAAAQCEGGVTVAGRYLPDGSYMPGGCAYTNPTTPGQLYPSGAQPMPSTNPAQGGSRLPGQRQPSDLIPVNSSDLGPAPSMVNITPDSIRPTVSGQNAGPGVSVRPNAVPNSTVMAPASGATMAPGAVAPAQLPSSGTPALTGNRAEPSANEYPGGPLGVGAATSTGAGGAAVNNVVPTTNTSNAVTPAGVAANGQNAIGVAVPGAATSTGATDTPRVAPPDGTTLDNTRNQPPANTGQQPANTVQQPANTVQPPTTPERGRVLPPVDLEDETVQPPGSVTVDELEEMFDDETETETPAMPQRFIPTGPADPGVPDSTQNVTPGTVVVPNATR